MPLFGRGKGKAVGYEFAVKVHAIEPWPGSYPCLAVAWQRGTGKKGVTKAANATRHPGADWASFLIEDTIHVSATLFQASKQADCLSMPMAGLSKPSSRCSAAQRHRMCLGTACAAQADRAAVGTPAHLHCMLQPAPELCLT